MGRARCRPLLGSDAMPGTTHGRDGTPALPYGTPAWLTVSRVGVVATVRVPAVFALAAAMGLGRRFDGLRDLVCSVGLLM